MEQKRQLSNIPADMTVGFIGAGRMAQAMIRGFISTGVIEPANITASDNDRRMLNCVKDFGIQTTQCNQDLVSKSKLIVIAVKPHIVRPVLQEVSQKISKDKIIVSIAAGIPISTIEQELPAGSRDIRVMPNTPALVQAAASVLAPGKSVEPGDSEIAVLEIRPRKQLELPAGSRVIRVMPNTPALVQAAASVLAPGKSVEPGDSEIVIELLKSIGICEPGSEKLLDAVTGLSGSGPAYAFTAIEALSDDGVKMGLTRDLATKSAFTAIEALSDGGVKMGLPRDLATKLAAQTLLGAAKMVLESGKHPGELKDQVCSPGGTTIAAVHKLEKAGFRAALIDAVEAATQRAQELGASN